MRRSSSGQLVRAGLWRWITGVGLERFELVRQRNGWALRGTILSLGDEGPTEAVYEVGCDAAWLTCRVDISFRDGSGKRNLQVTRNRGSWYENGKENKTVAGCIDVDLEWSPSTNTLPIRRLNLAVGQQSDLLYMAWVRFPRLTLAPLAQQYQRLSERSYLYTSGGGDFQATIDVDEDGLILDYQGAWQRVTGKP